MAIQKHLCYDTLTMNRAALAACCLVTDNSAVTLRQHLYVALQSSGTVLAGLAMLSVSVTCCVTSKSFLLRVCCHCGVEALLLRLST